MLVMLYLIYLTSMAVKAQSPPCSEYLFLSKVVTCSAPIRLHWAAHFSLVHCHCPSLHTLGGSRVKYMEIKWVRGTGIENQSKGESFLHTKYCISAWWCPRAGGCVCDGNKDNRLFLDTFLGEGTGRGDTHSPPHTPPCTARWLQQEQEAGQTHNWEDRKTRSPKTPDLWDTHDLEGHRKNWLFDA